MLFQFIEQSCLESVSKIVVIKMFYRPPEAVIRITALRNQAMNVGFTILGIVIMFIKIFHGDPAEMVGVSHNTISSIETEQFEELFYFEE